MAGTPPPPGWRLLQILAAVARARSLPGAARRLGLSRPTVGRQVRALETAPGRAVFRRRPKGLALTPAGQALRPAAEAMAEAAARLALAAAGRAAGLRGTVRIAASVFVARHRLPGIAVALRRSEPGIELEILASDRSANLLFRGADNALRMYRPDPPEVIARTPGGVPLGLSARRDCLDRRGRPAGPAELPGHDLVGLDLAGDLRRGLRALGVPAERGSFGLRCDDHAAPSR